VCKSIEDGGLGFRDIRKFNCALLGKWRWPLASKEKGRWKELLVSKYGADMDCPQAPIKLQTWWWRDLQKACTEGERPCWFQQQLVWKVGCGDKARLWEDMWVGNSNLKILFPMLFSLSLNQEQKVEGVGEWIESVWRWNFSWRRARFEWENVLEIELLILISRASLSRKQKDVQVWGCDDSGLFSVNSAYACLAKHHKSC